MTPAVDGFWVKAKRKMRVAFFPILVLLLLMTLFFSLLDLWITKDIFAVGHPDFKMAWPLFAYVCLVGIVKSNSVDGSGLLLKIVERVGGEKRLIKALLVPTIVFLLLMCIGFVKLLLAPETSEFFVDYVRSVISPVIFITLYFIVIYWYLLYIYKPSKVLQAFSRQK